MSGATKRPHRSLWEIFRAPLLLGLLSAAGLLSALIGDGWLDLMSWIALVIPVFVIGWYLRRRTA